LHSGKEAGEIGDRPLQMKVVKTRHHHYLGVNLNGEISQTVKLLSYIRQVRVPEDLAT
jgi:hypothetical protein